MTDTDEVAPQHDRVASAIQPNAEIAALQASVRRHRVWLVVLSVVMGIAACGALTLMGLAAGIGASVNALEPSGDDQVKQARRDIEGAYGDQLKDLEVRPVKARYGTAPFPFSLMVPNIDDSSIYVRYGIEGSDVVVANVIQPGMFGETLASSGMLPTKGSLVSRMTPEQFVRLLEAFGRQSKAPLGSVRRYGDVPYAMEPGMRLPDELTVGDKSYPTKQLWSVTEGKILEGDSIDMMDGLGTPKDALIFREDPETGEFEFLGTEPTGLDW